MIYYKKFTNPDPRKKPVNWTRSDENWELATVADLTTYGAQETLACIIQALRMAFPGASIKTTSISALARK